MAWYVSLTLRWAEMGGDLAEFLKVCREWPIPTSQRMVPESSWHSTVYAIAKIDSVGESRRSMRDGARAVLDSLRAQNLPQSLGELRTFRLRPSEVRQYTWTTSVQFDVQGDQLAVLRKTVTEVLRNVSISNIDLDVNTVFPMVDPNKNVGSSLFGSIARTLSLPAENRQEQQRSVGEFEPGCFVAEKLILTVSDDALTNDLYEGDFVTLWLQR